MGSSSTFNITLSPKSLHGFRTDWQKNGKSDPAMSYPENKDASVSFRGTPLNMHCGNANICSFGLATAEEMPT